MIPITFSGAGMLAGVATMLALLGYHTSDQDIARGMEAPYLFVRDTHGNFRAGAGLYRPQWLNLYLQPRGFMMTEHSVAPQDICAFLRKHKPSMFPLAISKNVTHPVVFRTYDHERYEFVNIKPLHAAEPDSLSLSAAMLKRRISSPVAVYTLEPCDPRPVDFIPLLLDSLDHLVIYQEELLTTRRRTVTRDEFTALHQPLFRALMQDLRPMMLLIDDTVLAAELRLLNHDYRHVFILDGTESVALDDRLPKKSIQKCILWLHENIVDRLYALGADEAIIATKAI